jgi:hypothetical protein
LSFNKWRCSKDDKGETDIEKKDKIRMIHVLAAVERNLKSVVVSYKVNN